MGEYINIGSCNCFMHNFNGSPDRMIGIDPSIFLKPHLGFGLSDLVCWLLAMILGNIFLPVFSLKHVWYYRTGFVACMLICKETR